MSAHTNGQPYTIVNGQRVNARSEYEPPVEKEKIVEEEEKEEPVVRPTFPVK